jgi:hypothetical protein
LDSADRGATLYYDVYSNDLLFYIAHTDGIDSYRGIDITKLQNEYLLINANQSDTGLQEFRTLFDANEWDGVSNTYYHEHSASGSSSNSKLQDDLDGTPTDITDSSITGANLQRSSGLTLTDDEEIDANIVTA